MVANFAWNLLKSERLGEENERQNNSNSFSAGCD